MACPFTVIEHATVTTVGADPVNAWTQPVTDDDLFVVLNDSTFTGMLPL